MNESSRTTELLLTVSKDARGTLGAQIEGQLRTRIRDGRVAGRHRAPVDPRPGPPARHLAPRRGRRLRAAHGRGLPERAPGRAPAGGRACRRREPGGRRLRAAGRRDPVRLPAQHARRDDLPAGGLGPLPAKRRDDDHRRRSELRRPARRRGAPLGTRRLPRPRAWRRRHDRDRRDHERLHTVPRNHRPRAVPGGRTADRARVTGRSRVRHDRPARRARARAGTRRRRRDPGRRVGGGQGRRRRRDARPPAPDRRRALERAAERARRLATRARRDRDRGRLRRRAPLRPSGDRRSPGARARSGGLRRLGEQDAGAGASARLARRAGAAARGGARGEAPDRPRDGPDRADRVRASS